MEERFLGKKKVFKAFREENDFFGTREIFHKRSINNLRKRDENPTR